MALVRMFAFWLHQKKGGDVYMTGKMGDAHVVIFKNKYKEKENQPDYYLYLQTERVDSKTQNESDDNRVEF